MNSPRTLQFVFKLPFLRAPNLQSDKQGGARQRRGKEQSNDNDDDGPREPR
jgi:hypothetical protein